MAINTLAVTGLVFSRNRNAVSPSFQASGYKIKNGYATNIGIGDLVKTGTGGNQGYVVLATSADTNILGVFAGVVPYFDTVRQQITNGKQPMGSYSSAAAPAAGVKCLVCNEPMSVFRDWLGFIGTGVGPEGN